LTPTASRPQGPKATFIQGNLPNLITFFRIALIPALILLLTQPGPAEALLATLMFHVACWSDFLDGYLARRWDISTTIGKLLDPLADKLIVAAALIMLASMHREPSVPGWMVALIIGRETAVTGLRAVALGQGLVVAAEELGKYKTVFQMFALHGLLLHYSFLGVDWFTAGMYFLWLALILGLWSGIDIHIKVIRQLASSAPVSKESA
jgi:CDP-diacylglycerol--glycerol-3-phosphate 3-phosphatidyltransferase